MRVSTVSELKRFLETIPDDFHVWGVSGDIFVAPPLERDKFQVFSCMQPDTEEMRKQMQQIAVSDFDCPS